MKKVLVTGGAGFIGSHLVPMLLREGCAVRVLDVLSAQVHGALPTNLEWLDSEGVEFIRGSIVNEADIRRAVIDIDVIVHLAAETGTGQSMYDIANYNEVNVQGTAQLLDILANDPKRTVKRIVLASSRSIYGEGAFVCANCNKDKRIYPESRSPAALKAQRWEHQCETCHGPLSYVPTHEDDRAKPASIYAATKYAQEDLVRIACASLGLEYCILRLQNVYGEGQSLQNPYTGILSIFSTKIRKGETLSLFEDGLESRDFVHVEDVANAFLQASMKAGLNNATINVGSGMATSIEQMACQLVRAFDGKSNMKVTGEYRVGDIRHNCADIARLRSELGLQPQISLEHGLKRFAKWVCGQPLPEDLLEQANQHLRDRKLMG